MKRKRRRSPAPPGPGRNLALRPGGGPHVPDREKRADERLRREIEEQREEDGGREPPEEPEKPEEPEEG